MRKLRYLGKQVHHPIKSVDLIPWRKGPILITLTVCEFACLCPVTAQPDFAKLTIDYIPKQYIVETKSLKLYLWNWRDKRVFNEEAVSTIADELFKQIGPSWLRVVGGFTIRGGILLQASAERGKLPPSMTAS